MGSMDGCKKLTAQYLKRRCKSKVTCALRSTPHDHISKLGEVCECGYEALLKWFLGRCDLGWSVLISGVEKLLLPRNSPLALISRKQIHWAVKNARH